MVTVKYQDKCDLCGQPVEIDGFNLQDGDHTLRFCCGGCQSIYQLIHLNKPTSKPITKTKQDEDKK